MNDEAAFEVTSPTSVRVLYDFQMYTMLTRHRLIMVFYIIPTVFVLLTLILTLAGFQQGGLVTDIILLAVMLAFLPVFFLLSAKRTLSSPLNRDKTEHTSFYADRLVNSDSNSVLTVEYDKVTDAYETKKYFYIYVERDRAVIIPKSDIADGRTDELRAFLKIKLGVKFSAKL